MQTSGRLYQCARCHAQAIICSRCDRGHRYCSIECSGLARAESCQRSAKKYQGTWAGRINNAARQQRFRTRMNQKVTHQGSAPKRLRDLLEIRLIQLKKASRLTFPEAGVHCQRCGAVCEPYLRHDFLHRSRYQRTLRRQDPF